MERQRSKPIFTQQQGAILKVKVPRSEQHYGPHDHNATRR